MILDNFLPNNSNDGFDHSLPRLPATAHPQKTNDELETEWGPVPGYQEYTFGLNSVYVLLGFAIQLTSKSTLWIVY